MAILESVTGCCRRCMGEGNSGVLIDAISRNSDRYDSRRNTEIAKYRSRGLV